VSAHLNLALSGAIIVTNDEGFFGPATGTVRYNVFITEQATGREVFRFEGGLRALLTAELDILQTGSQFPSLLDPQGEGVDFDGALESDPFLAPTGTPLTFRFQLVAGAGAARGSHTASTFSNTFGFPTDGPAFTLPPGYTVNSAQAKIRDNRFVPEAPSLCPAAPSAGCLEAAKASLSVKEGTAGNEKLKAALKGFDAPTTRSDFGDPVGGTTAYDLCVYGDEDELVTGLSVRRAGQNCGAKQKLCWKPKGKKGWSYRDPDASGDGVKKFSATSGTQGKGKLQLQAGNRLRKGQFSLPAGTASALQDAVSARLQIHASDGACFGAALGTVKKADGVQFKAKTP
jgi:hypothetical protein